MNTRTTHSKPGRANGRVVFITGATGNVGAMVTARLLCADPDAELILLVRGANPQSALERVEKAVSFLSPRCDIAGQRPRVRILVGDITLPGLGLERTEWKGLAERVTEIVHAAASTRFMLPLACAREINCRGTANVLDLALAARRRGRLNHFVHVSTAFVCGNRSGDIFEHDTDQPPGFSNSYERSKWEGEQLVRALMPELPVTIVRPSIVVGDSHTGRILTFNVLYTPLRMIFEGRLRLVPGRANAPLDVVSLDYVADAIVHVTRHGSDTIGRTLHLTAGPNRTLSVGNIVALSRQTCAGYTGGAATFKCRFIPPGICRMLARFFGGRVRRMWQVAEPFVAYMSAHRRFDTHNAERVLARCGIRPPALGDYLSTVLACAVECHWGRGGHLGGSEKEARP